MEYSVSFFHVRYIDVKMRIRVDFEVLVGSNLSKMRVNVYGRVTNEQ